MWTPTGKAIDRELPSASGAAMLALSATSNPEHSMALLIKNGEICTSTLRRRADILVEGETIAAIGEGLSAPAGAEVLDAGGCLVFPGFIDPHVHIYLPFMGTFAKDDYISGSRAALMGGTTTLIEMCCPSRKDDPAEALRRLLKK
jgi:dihydropyrimidinase